MGQTVRARDASATRHTLKANTTAEPQISFRPPAEKHAGKKDAVGADDFEHDQSPLQVVHDLWVYNDALGMSRDDIIDKFKHTLDSTNIFMRTNPQVMGNDLKGPFRAMAQLNSGHDAPKAVSIGDCHLGNFGTTPRSRFFRGSEKIVFTVVDRSKVSKAPIEWDLHRLASTTLTATWEDKGINQKDYRELLHTIYTEYFDELSKFAFDKKYDDGSRPKGWIVDSASKPIRQMIERSSEESPMAKVKKFTGKENGKKLSNEFEIKDKKELAAVKDGFAQYAEAIAKEGGKVVPLDFGKASEVGGSGSGLTHYYVLADVTSEGRTFRSVIHIKRLVPAPYGETSIKPDKRIKNREAINGIHNPLESAITLPGKNGPEEYLVHPYNGSEDTLEVSGGFKETQQQVKDAARVLARLHAQTLNRDDAKAWLTAIADPKSRDRGELTFDRAADKGAEFAQYYADASDLYRQTLAENHKEDPGPQ